MRIVLTILSVLVIACADDRQIRAGPTVQPSVATISDTTPRPNVSVFLVDFAVHEIMGDSVAKVVVAIGSSVDTIPGLFTSLNPIVTTDGNIHGIAMTAGGEANNGYDYDPRTRKLTLFPLPSDLNGAFNEIQLNHDAKYVAYVAHVRSGQTWAVVRSWPSMTIVARTSPSEGYPSDVGHDEVGWMGPDHFRISYRISSGPSIVVDGDAQRGTMKVDTVSQGNTDNL